MVVFACGSVSAQEYAFKVLINKGQNEMKAGKDWQPVRVGASLRSGDELRISPNGYLGLVHSSGKPLEVKDAGPHKVMELASRIKGGSSVLNKYTDFILSAKTDKQTNLNATGAVHRGPGEIKVFLPRAQQAIVFNDEIAIAWAKDPGTRVYLVRFNSMFGDELDSFEVRDTTLTIDLNGSKFENEDNIVVSISSKDDAEISSEDFILKKLSPGDKKRLATSLSEMSALTLEKNALNMLYLASFYEENALLIDASTAYQQAIRLAPHVPDYRDAYQKFVLRNNLKN